MENTHRAGRARVLLAGLAVFVALLMILASAPAGAVYASQPGLGGSLWITADATSVVPGGLLSYSVHLENGPDANVARLVNNLPSGMTVVSMPENCTMRNGSRIVCDIPLSSYASDQVDLTVSIDAGARCGSVLRDSVRVRGWATLVMELPVECPAP